nr:hypothetical protein [Tanacetum cinerariifolium]
MAPKKAAPKRTIRLNPGATSNPNQAPSTTTTTVTNAQLQAMIDQGVNAALATRDANRTVDDSHTSRTGVRRTERVTRECTYQDFMKPQPPTLSFTKEDAERFLAMPIPPPSPLTLLSSPLPQMPSPPLPASPPILLIPLPAASLPLQLLSSDRRADRPKVTLPPRKRLSIVPCPGYEAGESLVTIAARPIKDPRDVVEEEALTTLEGVNTRVTELAAVQEQDTKDIYGVMEDTQGWQKKIFQRVKALVDDKQYDYETGRLVDQEARFSREAWAHSMGLCSAGHLATALGEIRALQAREHARAGAPEGAGSST